MYFTQKFRSCEADDHCCGASGTRGSIKPYQRTAPESTMKKTLTKADIVEAIYEETDKNRVDVKNVVEKLLDIMKSAIKKDRALLISGFGKFECYDKASRKGRNPKTDETITLPQSVLRSAYNRGKAVDIIATTGKPGVVMSSIAQRMRETVARAHSIDPTDEKGIMVFNTEVLFQMLDNLFKGVNFLIWLVGIGTLLAGAIGVSNIMMVTVKERTTEIGIRRAIGATPKMILSQIISESILLTLVAGMSGILFGVAILQMLEVGSTTDGILTAHFQVDFWTAISSAILICILGGLAGLAPAWRAMSIKPVDAMRDE